MNSASRFGSARYRNAAAMMTDGASVRIARRQDSMAAFFASLRGYTLQNSSKSASPVVSSLDVLLDVSMDGLGEMGFTP